MYYTESIEFSNSHELGKLKGKYHLPRNDWKKFTSSLPELLTIKNKIGNIYFLQSGVLDFDMNFHPCPISFFYVEFIEVKLIECDNTHNNVSILWSIKVYSKDFAKYQEMVVDFNSNGRALFAAKPIVNTINAINLYIESGRPLTNLRRVVVIKDQKLGIDRKVILDTVSNLKFEFFEDSYWVVRKDNRYWSEAEITNLPTNKYLLDLIIQCLSIHHPNSVWLEENHIIVRYNRNSAYSSTYSRRNIPFDNILYHSIIDNLKVDMATFYDELECLFGKMETSKDITIKN